MKKKPDFYLASTETYNRFEPRQCYIEKVITIDGREGKSLLARIEPKLIGQPYGMGGEDINHLIVTPRFEGQTLYPINEWPAYVYVSRIVDEKLYNSIVSNERISSNDLQIILWGELYKEADEAEKASNI